jgi:hypothetical protein
MFTTAMAEDLNTAKRLFVEKMVELVDGDTFDGNSNIDCVCGQLAVALGIATIRYNGYRTLSSVEHGHTFWAVPILTGDLAEVFLPRECPDFKEFAWLVSCVYSDVMNLNWEEAKVYVEEVMSTE